MNIINDSVRVTRASGGVFFTISVFDNVPDCVRLWTHGRGDEYAIADMTPGQALELAGRLVDEALLALTRIEETPHDRDE
jgi:hypothetical protein